MYTFNEAAQSPKSWRATWVIFRTSNLTVPAILLLAIGLRIAVIVFFPIDPGSDSLWYLHRGRELAAGMGFQEAGLPTAFWPVGYPALVGIACAVFGPSTTGPILFNLLAQAATIVLILWFARALALGESSARMGALLYALYPAHIFYTADTAAEPTSTAVVMAGMALLTQARGRFWQSVAAGLLLGVATLMRPQILLLLPFVLVSMLIAVPGFSWREALRTGLAAIVGMAFVILPWTARNMTRLDAPVLVSTNGGFALQAGANSLADGGYFQVEKSPLWAEVGIPWDQRVAQQVAIDVRLKRMARRWITEHPVRWTLLGFRKVTLLWLTDADGFWPVQKSHPQLATVWKVAQAINQLFYFTTIVAGTFGFALSARSAWRRESSATLLVAAAMPVFCTAIAFGFSGQTRYHYTAMPFLMISVGSILACYFDKRTALIAAPPRTKDR
ncbi:hypothetical protein U1737_09190 [Sphingomonas sp. LB3N6]|uniref:ArnT family glycosyltransferase n=1 Tax=Sphingomonas fucosidasi TaxID=3096164 RepID=UPI002FC9B8D7